MKARGKLLTKGDNNPSVDSDLVMLEQVKGKVIATIPVGLVNTSLKERRFTRIMRFNSLT